MAFEFNDLKGFVFLVLLTLPVTSSTNIDCGGKPFYCLNATHFMICVDLGGGVSTTIDEFIIPCPATTVCHKDNKFECEFPKEETPPQLDLTAADLLSVLPPSTKSPVVTTVRPVTEEITETGVPAIGEVATNPKLELLEKLKDEFTGGNELFFETKTVTSTASPSPTEGNYLTVEKSPFEEVNFIVDHAPITDNAITGNGMADYVTEYPTTINATTTTAGNINVTTAEIITEDYKTYQYATTEAVFTENNARTETTVYINVTTANIATEDNITIETATSEAVFTEKVTNLTSTTNAPPANTDLNVNLDKPPDKLTQNFTLFTLDNKTEGPIDIISTTEQIPPIPTAYIESDVILVTEASIEKSEPTFDAIIPKTVDTFKDEIKNISSVAGNNTLDVLHKNQPGLQDTKYTTDNVELNKTLDTTNENLLINLQNDSSPIFIISRENITETTTTTVVSQAPNKTDDILTTTTSVTTETSRPKANTQNIADIATDNITLFLKDISNSTVNTSNQLSSQNNLDLPLPLGITITRNSTQLDNITNDYMGVDINETTTKMNDDFSKRDVNMNTSFIKDLNAEQRNETINTVTSGPTVDTDQVYVMTTLDPLKENTTPVLISDVVVIDNNDTVLQKSVSNTEPNQTVSLNPEVNANPDVIAETTPSIEIATVPLLDTIKGEPNIFLEPTEPMQVYVDKPASSVSPAPLVENLGTIFNYSEPSVDIDQVYVMTTLNPLKEDTTAPFLISDVVLIHNNDTSLSQQFVSNIETNQTVSENKLNSEVNSNLEVIAETTPLIEIATVPIVYSREPEPEIVLEPADFIQVYVDEPESPKPPTSLTDNLDIILNKTADVTPSPQMVSTMININMDITEAAISNANYPTKPEVEKSSTTTLRTTINSSTMDHTPVKKTKSTTESTNQYYFAPTEQYIETGATDNSTFGILSMDLNSKAVINTTNGPVATTVTENPSTVEIENSTKFILGTAETVIAKILENENKSAFNNTISEPNIAAANYLIPNRGKDVNIAITSTSNDQSNVTVVEVKDTKLKLNITLSMNKDTINELQNKTDMNPTEINKDIDGPTYKKVATAKPEDTQNLLTSQLIENTTQDALIKMTSTSPVKSTTNNPIDSRSVVYIDSTLPNINIETPSTTTTQSVDIKEAAQKEHFLINKSNNNGTIKEETSANNLNSNTGTTTVTDSPTQNIIVTTETLASYKSPMDVSPGVIYEAYLNNELNNPDFNIHPLTIDEDSVLSSPRSAITPNNNNLVTTIKINMDEQTKLTTKATPTIHSSTSNKMIVEYVTKPTSIADQNNLYNQTVTETPVSDDTTVQRVVIPNITMNSQTIQGSKNIADTQNNTLSALLSPENKDNLTKREDSTFMGVSESTSQVGIDDLVKQTTAKPLATPSTTERTLKSSSSITANVIGHVTEPTSVVETINLKDHKASGTPILEDMILNKAAVTNATYKNKPGQIAGSEGTEKAEDVNEKATNYFTTAQTNVNQLGSQMNGNDEKYNSTVYKTASRIELTTQDPIDSVNKTDNIYNKPSLNGVHDAGSNLTNVVGKSVASNDTLKPRITTSEGNYSKHVYGSVNTSVSTFALDKEQPNNSDKSGIIKAKEMGGIKFNGTVKQETETSDNSSDVTVTSAPRALDKNETQTKEMANKTPTISDPSTGKKESPNVNSKDETPLFNCSDKPRGRYADSKDCRKFYLCVGFPESEARMCPNNTVFSEINKQCTRNLSHCVRNNQFHCLYEGRFSDFLKDNIYYMCVKMVNSNGFLRYKLQCQSGYHLNKGTVQCEKNIEISTASASVSENSKLENDQNRSRVKESEKSNENDFECNKEGKFPYPRDCRKYYLCYKNNKDEYRRKLKTCDSDEIFDKKKKKCVTDSSEC